MDSKEKKQEISQKKQKKRHSDMAMILMGIVFIVFASILIFVLTKNNKDNVSTAPSETESIYYDDNSALTFEDMCAKITVKDYSCLLGETIISASNFTVNLYGYDINCSLVTMPDTSSAGRKTVQIKMTSQSGESLVKETSLNVLNIKKTISVFAGSPPVKYSDFVLDSSLGAVMDKEPSEFDYSSAGSYVINVKIGVLTYQCYLNVIAHGGNNTTTSLS